MNTKLIGELIKLRYKLMWARTRTRNGKIALFFAGYLLLVFFMVIFSLGGIGAGIAAVRMGKAHTVAAGVLGGLYFQALMATVLMGFGISAVFADVELRRYPLRARRPADRAALPRDRRPFLVPGGGAGIGAGARALRAGSRLDLAGPHRGPAAVCLQLRDGRGGGPGGGEAGARGRADRPSCWGRIMCLGVLPAAGGPALKKHPQLLAPLLRVLHYTPPYGAASAMLRPGAEAFYGLAVIASWLLGLSVLLVALERHPPQARVGAVGRARLAGTVRASGRLVRPGERSAGGAVAAVLLPQ